MENALIYDEWKEQLLLYKGILFNNRFFSKNFSAELSYKLDCAEFVKLNDVYSLSDIAGAGSEFERAARVTRFFAPKLTHKGDYDNHIDCNSLSLLEYSLNQPWHGINCVNKSKILQECCLALGIYSRRIWLLPYSPYDYDNHVVTEIYDNVLKKWIMLDLTSNGYFVDKNDVPLSVIEMRENFALNLSCNFKNLGQFSKHFESFEIERLYYNKYFAKNLFYLVAEQDNCFGDKGTRLTFLPLYFNDIARYKMNNAFRQECLYDDTFSNCKHSSSCNIDCLLKQPS